jgi:hypothetical protein
MAEQKARAAGAKRARGLDVFAFAQREYFAAHQMNQSKSERRHAERDRHEREDTAEKAAYAYPVVSAHHHM